MTRARKLGGEVLWRRRYSAGGMALIFGALIAGCAQAPEGEVHSSKVQHVTVPQATVPVVKLMLPAGGDVRQFGLVANGSLELRDRARVRDQQGAPLDVHNLGTVAAPNPATAIGSWDNTPGYAVGDLVSRGPVLLRDRAKVGGDVITAGTITKQNQVVVAGVQQAGATLPAPLELSFPQPLVADPARPPVVLAVDSTQVLEPGAYSQIIAYTRATLVLKSGNYAFSSFQLEPQAKLQLQVDPTKGPVVIYVDNVLAWRGTTVAGATDSLLLVYQGTQSIKFEQKLAMAVVAPKATVTLATGGLTHAGSLYAKGISLDPDVRFNYVPFKYWDWVLPPKPIAECVYPAGAGTYMAVFGYENGRGVEISVPVGSTNFFTPPSPRQISVSAFKPGRHKKVVWADMPSTGITWTVNGQSAKVDLNSPECDLREMAVSAGEQGDGRLFPPPDAPPTIIPNESTVFTTNGLGAGQFYDPQGAAAGSNSSGFVTVTQGLEIDPGPPGEPPALSLPGSGPLPSFNVYRIEAHGLAKKEGAWENAEIGIGASMGAHDYPVVPIDFDRNGDAEGSRTFLERSNGITPFSVELVEYDNLSRDDHVTFSGQLDDTLETYAGYFATIFNQNATPDPVRLNWPYGEAISKTANGSNNRDLTLDVTVTRTPAVAPEGTVKLCAYWPTAYWDHGQESVKGEEIGQTGLRGIPASFAKYFLTIVSAFEETHPSMPVEGEIAGDPSAYKYLDKDGCIPDSEALRIAQLAYFPGSPSEGTTGHTDFYLKVLADYARPTAEPGKYARYIVYNRADVVTNVMVIKGKSEKVPVWPPTPASMTLHFRNFGGASGDGTSDWTQNTDGLLVPPAVISVTGTAHNDSTNVAGTVGRMLAQLQSEQVQLPEGNYPIELGDVFPAGSGTPDSSCRRIGDSNFSSTGTMFADWTLPSELQAAKSGGVRIGGPLFPCEYGREIECRACADDSDCGTGVEDGVCQDGICRLNLDALTGENDCRKSCSAAEPTCPGGQLCYEETLISDEDPADDDSERGMRRAPGSLCQEGDTCFCGWGPQGASKISNAHEMGHLVQEVLTGKLSGAAKYFFDCPGTEEECKAFGEVRVSRDSETGEESYTLNDPPGTVAACKCDQVKAASPAHCLQSIEVTSSAQVEGYGQFFAAMLWNGPKPDGTPTACWFNYYKEFLNKDGTISYPPAEVPCGVRSKWRDENMCGAANMSTELDWMNFLLELKQTIGFTGLMDVYRMACHPENVAENPPCLKAGQVDPSTGLVLSVDQNPFANECYAPGMDCGDTMSVNVTDDQGATSAKSFPGRPIFWRDAPTTKAGYPEGFYDAGGFYDGAVRIWGADSNEEVRVRLLGNEHAVGDGTTPTP